MDMYILYDLQLAPFAVASGVRSSIIFIRHIISSSFF